VIRTHDSEVLREAGKPYPEMFAKVDVGAWVENKNNILLQDGDDVCFFTFEYPGVYTGHYFFKSKGRDVLQKGVEFLRWMFENYAKAIRGETPIENRPARLMNRKVGFKSYGIVDSPYWGQHEHFIMTQDEFNERYNNG
jgi:hypothetical protein